MSMHSSLESRNCWKKVGGGGDVAGPQIGDKVSNLNKIP